MSKLHLKYSAKARSSLKGESKIKLNDVIQCQEPKTKKEAYALSALALCLAKEQGEPISEDSIRSILNKLKGKNNVAQSEISQILNQTAVMIPGKTSIGSQVRSYLRRNSNKNMTKIVAETVLETIVPTGSKNAVIQKEGGWTQLFIASILVIGVKLFSRMKNKS